MQIIKDNILWIVLAITLVLVYSVSQEDNMTEESTVVKPRLSLSANTKTVDRQPIKTANNMRFELRKPSADMPINLFDVPVVEQALPAYQPPPTPMAPANPYRYVGKLLEQGELRVFLTNGQKNYVVKKGDTLEQGWKVKTMSSTNMVLLNIPTHTEVTVHIGALL